MNQPIDTSAFLQSAKRTIQLERQAVHALEQRLGPEFVRACELLLACQGRVVIMGMGKSGHIGHKLAATLASTGTPSFFVHPADAGHGDLGMIKSGDVLLAISNSGNAVEIVGLLPMLKRLEVPLVSLTGNSKSTLAQAAAVNLDISVASEACPLDLAPTSSTTVSLVLGDALAVALLEARGFTREDFAFSHPSGKLGKQLLLRVEDLMHRGELLPRVHSATNLLDALKEISDKRLGMTTVVDDEGTLVGIFTDGDLRRALDAGHDVRIHAIGQLMTTTPMTTRADVLAIEALKAMEGRKIMALVVIDEWQRPTGVLHMHDLITAGLV